MLFLIGNLTCDLARCAHSISHLTFDAASCVLAIVRGSHKPVDSFNNMSTFPLELEVHTKSKLTPIELQLGLFFPALVRHRARLLRLRWTVQVSTVPMGRGLSSKF